MHDFVWCKKEDRRIPFFRCLVCGDVCYPEMVTGGDAIGTLRKLVESGRYKEHYVMRRKDGPPPKDSPSVEKDPTEQAQGGGIDPDSERPKDPVLPDDRKVFLLEEGELRPFAADQYTASTLYQVVEAFDVECRLVRPEDAGSPVFDGKRPAKKTLPIIVTKAGQSSLLESWESLETNPAQLADAAEVIAAIPVKQVFVLRKK